MIKDSILFILLLVAVFNFGADGQQVASSPKATLFDEFYWQNGDEANARLENMLIGMQNVPESRGSIIFYCGRKCFYGEAEAHFMGIRQAFNFRRYDLSKVSLVFGGFREKATTSLWIVPKSACEPMLTPSLSTTDISFVRARRKVLRPYWCC